MYLKGSYSCISRLYLDKYVGRGQGVGRYRVTIPKKVREMLMIKKGDTL